mmetsp:Transcript_22391/g.70139  ORF Transcript_22391/g.70139 Transcript_22391/m.70139 type:complete len:126 (-) Transcript_22391:55-432(-)
MAALVGLLFSRLERAARARWVALRLSEVLVCGVLPRLRESFLPLLLEEGEEEAPVATDGALWLAAPKKRVSRSRKRIRTSTMKLRPIVHLRECPACGKPKLPHKLSKCCVAAAIEKTREIKAGGR